MPAETKEEKADRKSRARLVRERTAGYIVTSLGLVVGLAWNDAISTVIKYFFPIDNNTMVAKIIYASILTIIIVLISDGLLRNKDKDSK
jgi:hypothetical protein